MDGVMFGIIKYENLLLGAFLFSLFTLMYCAILHIKLQIVGEELSKMLIKVNHNIKIIAKLNLDIKDEMQDIEKKKGDKYEDD